MISFLITHRGQRGSSLITMTPLPNHISPPQPPPLPTDDLGPRPPSTSYEPSAEPPRDAPPPPRFDPSRMIGIIRRKALIKDLAAIYHAEGLTYCQQLLELQRKFEEPHIEIKTPEDTRKEMARPTKRMKKTR
ncbi:uncharacterized protein LOC116005036 isoform X3 [Ipomoea triloba]|uniref:uncharacterized protein LOC116005036 isoform X3 n=1 Tax=Ipomoea triloba TaxID=35885 RepID=UPI00125E3CF0|nr:uncharacterized protein LOC116005036 isoform X3 [Ipomoea triloba]